MTFTKWLKVYKQEIDDVSYTHRFTSLNSLKFLISKDLDNKKKLIHFYSTSLPTNLEESSSKKNFI